MEEKDGKREEKETEDVLEAAVEEEVEEEDEVGEDVGRATAIGGRKERKEVEGFLSEFIPRS